MDVTMVEPWVLFSQKRFMKPWAMDVFSQSGLDVIMLGPRLLSSQNGLDSVRPWTSSWLDYGCSLLRTD